MIVYSVKINIKNTAEAEWLHWMKEHHIKDVLSTNYFQSWEMFRILNPESSGNESSYVIHYITDSREKYEAYHIYEAERLQKEHREKFTGLFTASRTVMELITG